jgi:hypothetical protein
MPDADYIEVQVGGARANCRRRGVALVDVADAEAVGAYAWSMNGGGYAVRTTQVGGKCLAVLMHRFLLGLVPGDGVHVDHVNGDKLDNRRANLRLCTPAQNQQNLHNRPYRGAAWHGKTNRWSAQVYLTGRKHHLGHFASQAEAAEVAAAFRREHMPFSRDARTPAA